MDDIKAPGRLSEEQGQLLVELARKTIMEKLNIAFSSQHEDLLGEIGGDPLFQENRGVFVTLHRGGQLRGCIGNLGGTTPITKGVKDNANNAAFNDFRFSPVTVAELEKIEVEVSILSEPKALIFDGGDDLAARLRPDIDGVIIRKGGASATFLPQVWKQLPDVEMFLSHLCQKAALPADEWRQGDLEVMTYQVQYFTEER